MDLELLEGLVLIEEVWRRLDVDARTQLCRVSCYYKRVYLHSAFQILQLKTPKKDWSAFLEHEVTRDLDFGCWDFRLVGASSDFCAREDAPRILLERCLKDKDDTLNLLCVSSSCFLAVGPDASLLSGRAGCTEAFLRDAWTLVACSLLRNLVAKDKKTLAAVRILHGSLRAPVERATATRSWPSRKALDQLKEVWACMKLQDRKSVLSLKMDFFWYFSACKVAYIALKMWKSHRDVEALQEQQILPESLLQDVQRLFPKERSLEADLTVYQHVFGGSPLLSSLSLDEASQSTDVDDVFCECSGSLGLLLKKSCHHASQQRALLTSLFGCDYREVIVSRDFPLIAHKDTRLCDVERVVATLMLTNLLSYAELHRQSAYSTEQWRAECLERKQKKVEQKKARIKTKKQKQAPVPDGSCCGRLTHAERFRVHRLLATSPTWDLSCLRVKHTFWELPEKDPPSPRSLLPLEW